MRTDDGFILMSNVAPVLGTLIEKLKSDDEFKKQLEKAKNQKENSDNIIFFFKFLLPELLKIGKDEIIEIASIINGVPLDEYKAQPFPQTMKDITNIINDKDWRDFFSLFIA